MKNKILLVFCLFISCILNAQDVERKDEMKVGQYLVRTIQNADNTYGFEVYDDRQKKIIIKQLARPFYEVETGFKERQNAVVAALWFVQEYKEGRKDIKRLDLEKAKQIGITDSDL